MLNSSKIVVICGGLSSEREISLRSGRNCFNSLKRKGYNVSLLDLQNIEQLLELKAAHEIDLAFLTTHGSLGEDGKLQSVLEWLGIPYTGSKVLASALAMNKFFSKQILKANGITVPSGKLLKDFDRSKLQLPLMLKPLEAGSSIGISKINSQDQLAAFVLQYHAGMDLT